MEVRSPSLSESRRINSLRDESLRDVDSAYQSLTQNPLRHWLARNVALPSYFHWLNEGWVLADGSEIIGWLYLLHRVQTTHINDLGVAPGYRRRGYGRRLLEWAEQRASEKGKAAVTLAVTVANQPAVSLYEGAGYAPVHHRRWKGESEKLPLIEAQFRIRELELSQRPSSFGEMWRRSLEADQRPIHALIEDQIGHWYASGGRAWELWREERFAGYADLVERTLRLFMAAPGDRRLLQEAWSALRGTLPGGTLVLDLGSDTADRAASDLLHAAAWSPIKERRMLMVKSI